MQRFSAKTRIEERKKIKDMASQPSSAIIETNDETATKFFAGKSYTKEDITSCVKSLLAQYEHNFDHQFAIMENILKFDQVFEKFDIDGKQPFFVVYGKPTDRWVLFCLIRNKNEVIKMLYKDSSGAKIPLKLEDKIRKKIPLVEIVVQNIKDQDQDDHYLYGPLCLRNLKIMLECFKKDAENFIENFSKVQFSVPVSLNKDKFNNVISLTNELSENVEFKIKLREFIDKLPLDWGSDMLEYKKIMEEELEKDEEDVDINKIKETREKYLKQENIDKFLKDYKLNEKEMTEESKEFELDIQKVFPDEMKKLSKILEVLDNIKIDKQLYAALENISEILDIDYKKMKSFYEFKLKKDDRSENEKLNPDSISDIAKNLPTMRDGAQIDCTPLEQLLAEITLGMDQNDSSCPQHSQEDIQDLERKYHLVKNKYENWKNSNIHDINIWAKSVKGHLGTSDDDICETMANMDRALNLLTGGHRLRDTQILAVLIFLHGENNQGRLCQIKTGEGKTVIVSLLAVIRALQGHTVDGGRNDFKIGYSADVLYGTISNFQFDYLKDTFEGFNIRNERRFGQVILDEVDSMLVDNGGHIAKLASPYPGMESLRYIYIKIWQELHKAEESFVEETQAKIKEFLKQHPDKTEAKMEYEKFIQEIIRNERKIIKDKIKASNPTACPLVPAHLKEYLKHNLHLTFESLTSSFISNIGYIKNYADKFIFGLTGTLGSRAEQELLSNIYNINYAKLPTYKQKTFDELPGLVTNDSSWHILLTVEVMEKIDEGRAVLVICETEQDLLTVEKNLQILQNVDFRIRIFANEDNAKETDEKVKIGDIILATNIAGRGTNFKTEEDLEANGGLHVCVGFLPCNLRVEGQAFGRTSRQGNSGTAQLIIRQSEVDELGILEENPNFTIIKQERDRLERERLEEIKNILVRELNFKDELFGYFSEFYRNLKQEKLTREYMFVLQDLKEFWAFWLEKKNFKGKNLGNVTPEREFKNFITQARNIIDGHIQHNPFYCVALADHYLEKGDRTKAASMLHRAIDMSHDENFDLLAGAHLKLFEIAIADGEQVMERFRKAVANIFFINVSKNENYKHEALKHLNHAEAAVKKEIDYIEKHLTVDEQTGNKYFQKILKQNEVKNLFLKHVYSRLCCLKVHYSNITHLKEMIQTIPGGVDLNGTAETTLKNLDKMDPTIKWNYMKGKFISYGVSLITFGISAITQSVTILTKAVAFCRKLSSFLRNSTYLKNLCNKLANLVDRMGDFLEGLLTTAKFNKLSEAEQLDELTKLKQTGQLEKFKQFGGFAKLAELEDLQKAGKLKELTRTELLVGFMKKVGMETGKNVAKSLVKEYIINPMLSLVFQRLIQQIKEHFKNILKKSIRESDDLMEKLRTTLVEEIDEALDEFNDTDEVVKTAKEIAFDILGQLNSSTVDALTLTCNTITAIKEIDSYVNHSVFYLRSKLQGGDQDNNVDLIVDDICTKFSDKMFSLLLDILKNEFTILKDNMGVILGHNLKKVGDSEETIFGNKSKNGKEQNSITTTEPVKKKEDPCLVLGLPSNASLVEVKRKYRILALQTHPDKNLNDPNATEKMQKINDAYDEF
ncbi:uncharacterized protein BDFB_010502, partial [Asbolus verrucosus]